MGRCGFVCLLLLSVAWGQNGKTGSTPVQNADAPKSTAAPAPPNKVVENAQPVADKIPQDAPVITIAGLCEHPIAGKSFVPDCKTVITRAEFENIVNLLQPGMSRPASKFLAYTYIQTLVKAQKAMELGLDKRPDFDSRVEVLRLFVNAKGLYDILEKREWDKVTDKEIEDYYHNNPGEFVEVDVDRIFVPYFPPDEDPKQKLSDAEKQKRIEEWRKALKNEAEKLRTRAIAGESFYVLQDEANKFTDLSNGPVTVWDITLNRLRRSMLGSGEIVGVMDVEPGKFTPVFTEDNGYYVFRVNRRAMLPFDKMRDEIHKKISDERFERDKAAIEQVAAASAVYNDNYFGPPPKDGKAPASGAAPAHNQP